MKTSKSFFFLLLIFPFTILLGDIINVPADIDSIQGGINLASDGDTVLVDVGTYYENINFNGKNIVVGSLTLTTGDTSYISQTVIDGDSSGSVVTFENGEDTTAVLSGFTITNGISIDGGGGIHIYNASPVVSNATIINNSLHKQGLPLGGGIYLEDSNAQISQVKIISNRARAFGGPWNHVGEGGGISCVRSNPTLTIVEIKNNFANNSGGGIFLYNSHPTIQNSLISNNDAVVRGGGIYCDSSSLVLNNVIIKEDSAIGGDSFGGYGGGVFLSNSNAEFNNVLIMGNWGDTGGGIICSNSNLDLLNVTISDNTGQNGSGIHCGPWNELGQGFHDLDSSKIYLSNVTISNNYAPAVYGSYGKGGGIFSGSHTRLNFDSLNRCNIYNNHADSSGSDLFSITDTIISVIVDTFTVLNPNSTHAYPLNKFTFDIRNATVTDISKEPNILPNKFNLNQNYPNPFNPSTTIEFTLPKSELTTLKVYNILGKEVSTLVSKKLNPGNYNYRFDGSNLASGVYYYQFVAGDYREVKKMILLR